VESISFRAQLEEYCRWARDERRFTEATVKQYYSNIKQFLRWYDTFDRDLSDVQVSGVDAFIGKILQIVSYAHCLLIFASNGNGASIVHGGNPV
jgi:site-specific recombinase XerD